MEIKTFLSMGTRNACACLYVRHRLRWFKKLMMYTGCNVLLYVAVDKTDFE